MLISGLFDKNGRKALYRSGFSKGHLRKGGLDTEASPHDLEPTDGDDL